jgi:hypothetical protein
MVEMNPNYLLKDELLYELDTRGISSDADIQTLRKLFRSVSARDLPLEVSYLQELGGENLYESDLTKLRELQTLVTQPGTKLCVFLPRLRTKILHLRARLSHLQTPGFPIPNLESSSIKALYEQLAEIEERMAHVEEPQGTQGRPRGSSDIEDVKYGI